MATDKEIIDYLAHGDSGGEFESDTKPGRTIKDVSRWLDATEAEALAVLRANRARVDRAFRLRPFDYRVAFEAQSGAESNLYPFGEGVTAKVEFAAWTYDEEFWLAPGESLGVAILGQPGDTLIAVVTMNGSFHGDSPGQLQGFTILNTVAQVTDGWRVDISAGGAGTEIPSGHVMLRTS